MIHTKQCEEILDDVSTITRNILHTYDIHLKISNNYMSKYPLDIISHLIFFFLVSSSKDYDNYFSSNLLEI